MKTLSSLGCPEILQKNKRPEHFPEQIVPWKTPPRLLSLRKFPLEKYHQKLTHQQNYSQTFSIQKSPTEKLDFKII